MKILLMVVAVLFTMSSFAAKVPAAQSKTEFCKKMKDSSYPFRLISDFDNRLGFTNHGGLLNGGLCWWHSRFQRSSNYLVYFRPDLPKPSIKEAKKIIRKIKQRMRVVVIPGYQNLKTFSLDFEPLVQKEIARWQIIDGFVNQMWLPALLGFSKAPTSWYLKRRMKKLYKDVHKKKRMTFQMLQLKGINTHAWLVTKMEKVSGGFKVTAVDSNYKNFTFSQIYKYGDKQLKTPGGTGFVPYTMFRWELRRMKRIVKRYCK